MIRQLTAIAAIGLLASIGHCETTAPRIGEKIIPPNHPRTERTYSLIKSIPVAKITKPGELVVEFETIDPTPPVQAYFGINTIDEELDYPRFRWFAAEDGETTDLRTQHRVVMDFSRVPSYAPNTAFEPRIAYRLEVYLPYRKSTRFVEGRAYFDPETLGDTVNITMGPFVDQVTPESAVIVFETDRLTTSAVLLNGAIAASDEETTRHEIHLGGLEAGRLYAYSVAAGNTRTRNYEFETTPADAEEFVFAAMVDSREGVGGGERQFYGVEARSLAMLGAQAYYEGAKFIVFAGDLINGYTSGVDDFRMQLRSFVQAMAPVHARIPIYESMGNHESLVDAWDDGSRTGVRIDKAGSESAEAIFAETFCNPLNGPQNEGEGTPTYAENVYWFDYGNSRFILLNNNYWWSSNPHKYGGNLEGYILPEQIKWLRGEVERANNEPKIKHLFFAAQEPPFPNGGHTSDAMWYKGGDTNRDGKVDEADIKIVENRNEMWQIIASSPKSVAFITGDEHAYSRLIVTDNTDVGHKRLPDGSEAKFAHPIWQITSGGAGAPWYDKELDLPWSGNLKAHSTLPHVALFKVSGDDVELTARSQYGQPLDNTRLRTEGRNTVE